MAGRLARAVATTCAAAFGLCAGCFGGFATNKPFGNNDYPFLAESVPLPHHVPQHADGVSLRFAMVHDVIHERYPKHGRAYFEQRNRLTQQKLNEFEPTNPITFPLADDLAVELDRLGRTDEAVAVIRDKLARQKARGLPEDKLYTSYANLGTFLTYANFQKAAGGDAAARERFREGVELVKKSVAVNPMAHFGREQWQVAIAEFHLAAMHDTGRLRKFDCLGNRLDLPIEQILNREINWIHTGHGRAVDAEFARGRAVHEAPAYFQPGARPDDPDRWAEFRPLRDHITKVGAEDGWVDVTVLSHREPVAFDGPVLGIVGMWRQGNGANPHFALALGETMLRVGQRHIAWSAFERAARLADQFWPDAASQEFLRDHCRKRQSQIEETLAHVPTNNHRPDWRNSGTPLSPAEVAELRPRFESELAYGERYQRAYQEFEEKQIAANVPITDEHFYDAFNTGREPIASPVGPEEQFVWVPREKKSEYTTRRMWAWGALGAGLAALLAAALLRWRRDPGTEQRKAE